MSLAGLLPILMMNVSGSPADKADLEVADEILEINGKPLHNSSHTEVINHIHNVSHTYLPPYRVGVTTNNFRVHSNLIDLICIEYLSRG